MKKIIITLLVLLTQQYAISASNKIKGIVTSKDVKIEFANVLITKTDSTFVTGTASNQDGEFEIDPIDDGNYLMIISCLGYESKKIRVKCNHKSENYINVNLNKSTIELDNVVVTPKLIIDKVDKRIYTPSFYERKASNNGIELLQQIKLCNIFIDPINDKAISNSKGKIIFLKDGIESSIKEIKALSTKEIKNIEYIENPSLKYGNNIACAINYITKKKKKQSTTFFLDTQNALNSKFKNYVSRFKYKKGELTLSALYYGNYQSYDHFSEDRESTMYLEPTITRTEIGLPSYSKENSQHFSINPNYKIDNSQLIDVKIKLNTKDLEKDKRYILTDNSAKSDEESQRYNQEKKWSTTINVYYEKKFNKKSHLFINLNGEYNHIKAKQSFTKGKTKNTKGINKIITERIEIIPFENQILKPKISETKEKNIALDGRITYEKRYSHSSLSNSLSGSFSKNNFLHYSNDVKSTLSEYYLSHSIDYRKKYKKTLVALEINSEVTGSSHLGEKITKFNVSPSYYLNHKINKNLSFSIRGKIDYILPTIGELDETTIYIDDKIVKQGNKELSRSTEYYNQLGLNYNKGIFAGSINLNHTLIHHPIMESVVVEENQLVRKVENQKQWSQFSPSITLRFGPIFDIFNLSLNGEYDIYTSKGKNYSHHFNDWSANAMLTASIKKWNFMGLYFKKRTSFWGETATYQENMYILSVKYNFKNFYIGALSENLFKKPKDYYRPTFSYNKNLRSTSQYRIDELMNMFLITFGINL